MSDLLPFVIAGLASGSIFGLAGMGLVLTYKTSGIFNFAHGAVATAAAYTFHELRTVRSMPWPLAGAITLGVFAPAAGIGLERIARRLADASTANKIVGTLGLLLAVQGGATILYGSSVLTFQPFLPTGTFAIGSTQVGYDQAIVVVLALIAAAALYGFFRASRTGIAMRGVVDDPSLLSLSGTSPVRVRVQAWVIGSIFAALSGILIAPQLGLDSILLTLLVVQAFGAAAIGRFSSLPLTHVGGLIIGIGASVSTRFVGDVPTLAGVPSSLPFIVLFVVLLTFRSPAMDERIAGGRERPSASLGERTPSLGVAVVVASLVVVPFVVGSKLPVWTNGLVFVILLASLALLVNTSGQVSLCHAGFAAVGAATFSHLASGAGLPWLVALLGAGLAAVPIGAVVAIPAIRLSGIFLALATFGFGILLERMVFNTSIMFGAFGNRPAPRPDLLIIEGTSDHAFYFVVLAVVLLTAAALWAVQRSRLGILLRALADAPVALNTHGANSNVTLVLVFCITAFLAGLAGALLGASSGSISGVGFGPFDSLTWLVVLAISGSSVLRTGAIAAVLLAIAPAYLPTWFTDYRSLGFGALALAASTSLIDGAGLQRIRASLATTAPRRVARSPVRDRTRHSFGEVAP
ncbi:MAG TPA: ABC transporter permease [Acidimicrobiales bacterium]